VGREEVLDSSEERIDHLGRSEKDEVVGEDLWKRLSEKEESQRGERVPREGGKRERGRDATHRVQLRRTSTYRFILDHAHTLTHRDQIDTFLL